MKLCIAIDDVSPLKNFRILGEKSEKYLKTLNERYGVLFTLFIPSNLHGKAKLSDNKSWVKEIQDWGIFELAAHGYYHQSSNPSKYGVMEFYDITHNECIERIKLINQEWESVNIKPQGWRNPGWVCQPYCAHELSKHFNYFALHYEHNQNIKWDGKMIFGADGINETEISLHQGNILFQSHIFGSHIDNEWRKSNFDQIDKSLEYIFSSYNPTPITMNHL